MRCFPLMVIALVAVALTAQAQTPTVLVPANSEPAYRIAGETFCEMWAKVTGATPKQVVCDAATEDRLPAGDIVLIGSDAVQPVIHRLILQGRIESLGIAYGTDDYRILALPDQGRTLLILAGGAGRSTIYAVYDFFRKRAGFESFWDGDLIPKRSHIELAGADYLERPHFAYRGLRYFAHRGPHRFHAELWDFEDWKREIDWMLKKRFNLFMLRTGIDDLFQRAFPGQVPYPPEDGVDPDAADRSYDDRTSFWPLKYRGELRKRVLQYARDRGLVHPEDTGTITHWYSHTPSSFYKSNPDFPTIKDQKSGYSRPTQAVWDTEAERTWETYWKLTETHIREFGSPRIFHTIGLAERTFGTNPRENLQRKLDVYRKTQAKLRRYYPDAPLLIASWDMMGWWKNEDVQNFLKELDPQRTIMFDYTADLIGRKTYQDWDVYGKFPWIYGIFHAYASNSEVRGEYRILEDRVGEAARDPKCLGLVLWPEISHSDTFKLEYLADNAWNPKRLGVSAAITRYCEDRYPSAQAASMNAVWRDFMPIAETLFWSDKTDGGMSSDPQFRLLTNPSFTNLTGHRLEVYKNELRRLGEPLHQAPAMLDRLAGMADACYENELWRRDAIDIVRTTICRALQASLIRACLALTAPEGTASQSGAVQAMETVSKGLMQDLADVLALSDDYSLERTMRRLDKAGELSGIKPRINPHTEQTLKSNSENNYCRAHQYELVRYVYQAELDEYWRWVNGRKGSTEPWTRPATFNAAEKAIQDRFYSTPLKEMAPTQPRSASRLCEIAGRVQKRIEALLAMGGVQ